MTEEQIADIEIKLLEDGLYKVYGYDFRDYAEASLKRRLTAWLSESKYRTFSESQSDLLRDPAVFESLLNKLTVNVSEMFRDPHFFSAIREKIIPYFQTYPFIKIWHAGCSTGEEAYSMAILLHEEGLQGRFRIYATDINREVLQKAQEGIYPLHELQKFTRNYQQSGGTSSFSDYYTARYDYAIFSPILREDIVFAPHNLAVDSDFGEMNMILCRNVMIYFKLTLKERVLKMFDNALLPGGYLCLGLKESLEHREVADKYELVAPKMQIYRKRYGV